MGRYLALRRAIDAVDAAVVRAAGMDDRYYVIRLAVYDWLEQQANIRCLTVAGFERVLAHWIRRNVPFLTHEDLFYIRQQFAEHARKST